MRSGETLPKEGRLNFDVTCRKNAERGRLDASRQNFLKAARGEVERVRA